jgi:hypothetical protein
MHLPGLFRVAFGSLSALVLVLFSTSTALAKPRPAGIRNLTQVTLVAVTVDPSVFRRDSLDDICTAAISMALRERDFRVAPTALGADAVLTLKGGSLTITQGRAEEIGNTVLNYVASLRVADTDKELFTTVGGTRGETAAAACSLAAEEIADKLDDAKSDADEDEGMED